MASTLVFYSLFCTILAFLLIKCILIHILYFVITLTKGQMPHSIASGAAFQLQLTTAGQPFLRCVRILVCECV